MPTATTQIMIQLDQPRLGCLERVHPDVAEGGHVI
jgi:hypothetical protein